MAVILIKNGTTKKVSRTAKVARPATSGGNAAQPVPPTVGWIYPRGAK